MNKNLLKRIYTSIILLLVLLFSLFFHKYSWLLLLIIASVISFFEFNNLTIKIWKRKKTSIVFANFVSIFYLIFFIYSAYDLRLDIIIVLLVCIFSDIGGYIVGKSIGGKKLTKISPNKTISGSIGSFVFASIPMIIYLEYLLKLDPTFLNAVLYWKLVSSTLIVSLMCQTGDIFISYFKRKAKVKDTGSILPGHGGLLDRIDGIIFVIPGVFILDKIFF